MPGAGRAIYLYLGLPSASESYIRQYLVYAGEMRVPGGSAGNGLSTLVAVKLVHRMSWEQQGSTTVRENSDKARCSPLVACDTGPRYRPAATGLRRPTLRGMRIHEAEGEAAKGASLEGCEVYF